MKGRHIAFFNLPHRPHVNPTLAMVSTLVRRGFRVSYVSPDLFAPKLEEVGASVVPGPRLIIPPSMDIDFLDLAGQALSTVAPFFENDRPDLILYDYLYFAGRILARQWNVPAIQTSPAFAVDREHVDDQIPDPAYRRALIDYAEKFALQLRQRHGVDDGNYLFHRERLNIYLYPRAFQLPGNAFDETCYYAGRCAAEQPYHGQWRRPDTGGRPIVLVSTSTALVQGPDYFRMCISALSRLPWHVVLAIGDNNAASDFEPLPPHFEILQNISQAQVLPHADLFVCLGGMISSVEAMYHGVPMILITHGWWEAEWYAENMVKLGVGLHLRKAETNEQSLRAAVLRVAEDSALIERVRRMQYAVQRENGAEATANRIEEYLESNPAP